MIDAIVTDIEGTTTSISFVHDVLFPYAYEHLPRFLTEHAEDAAVSEQLVAAAREAGHAQVDVERLAATLREWIREDRKVTSLKALQGMVWAQGYRDGRLKAHVYDDTAPQLRAWHAQGKRLFVYSSGSVAAQKLLFGHTPEGDLTPLFEGYFDTRIGHKREAASYRAIVQSIGLPADTIGFMSDIGEELDAAAAAGMQTVWLVRDGALDPEARHRQVATLTQVGW